RHVVEPQVVQDHAVVIEFLLDVCCIDDDPRLAVRPHLGQGGILHVVATTLLRLAGARLLATTARQQLEEQHGTGERRYHDDQTLAGAWRARSNRSHTSRTAPSPPLCVVTQSAASMTSACASAT